MKEVLWKRRIFCHFSYSTPSNRRTVCVYCFRKKIHHVWLIDPVRLLNLGFFGLFSQFFGLFSSSISLFLSQFDPVSPFCFVNYGYTSKNYTVHLFHSVHLLKFGVFSPCMFIPSCLFIRIGWSSTLCVYSSLCFY